MTDDLSNREPIDEALWRGARDPNRRCVAHKKTGEQCSKVAMEAQQVCGSHGGRAPQSKRAARRRLDEAADRMAKQLLQIADSAESEADKLSAVKEALDRAGIVRTDKVDVEVGVRPWEQLADKIVGIGTMTREESRARRGLPPALDSLDSGAPTNSADSHQDSATSVPSDGEIVEAEIVDDHEPTQTSPARPAGMRTDDDAGNRPGKGLMPYEDALVLANKINRRAGVYGRRRR